MRKDFKYSINQGLPGGANELKKFVKGSISVTGYKSDSPDVNNDFNIIPSNRITMQGVNFPVLGVDDLGYEQMMMPGGEYNFPGNYVTEIPQMGKGGLTQWFDEKWTDVKTGKPCGRSGKEKGSRPYPACRPSKRVNETTPKTTSELSSAEKAKFKREKTSGKRISYNHKRREYGGETGWLDQYQVGGPIDLTEEIKGLKDQWYTTQEWDDAMPDSTFENLVEFIDPTGITSYDDARVAYRDWKRSGTAIPSFGQGLEMFGAVPGLGKLSKLKYLANSKALKPLYKYFPWQQTLNAADTVQDEYEKKYGGWLEQYQPGGHIIQPDETFYGIANKYGFNKQELINVNPGLDIDKIRPGQKINLPTVEKIEEVNISSANKKEPTSWYDYINPFNWGAPNYDDAGTFKQAFRKARIEDQNDFMYYGDRYSSDLAQLPENKKDIVKSNDIKITRDYNNDILYKGLSDVQKERRKKLLQSANKIANTQDNSEALEKLLVMTAVMENTLGADKNAYGRTYTRNPMSIDDIAYDDLFKVRKGAKDYTKSQKQAFDWLKTLGYDYRDMDKILRSDDPTAGMAAARLYYGRNTKPLPKENNKDALYNYYMEAYNKGGVDKYKGKSGYKDKWDKYYNLVFPENTEDKKYGGWLDSYQDGGETLPQLNSKMDVANFYKNPLSEKYGIAQNPDSGSFEYYLKSGQSSNPIKQEVEELESQNLRKAYVPSLSEEVSRMSDVVLPEVKQQQSRSRNIEKTYELERQKDFIDSQLYNQPIGLQLDPTSLPIPSYSGMNPIQEYYANLLYDQYGKFVVTDKGENKTFYGTKTKDGDWDVNSFEVLTGRASDPRYQQVLKEELAQRRNDQYGITPIGVFPLSKKPNYYGSPGFKVEGSTLNPKVTVAYHTVFNPEKRLSLFENEDLADNYVSSGCINCKKPNLEALINFVGQNGLSATIDSRLPLDKNIEWTKKNTPKYKKWLDNYK
jgi:hypothetical protein